MARVGWRVIAVVAAGMATVLITAVAYMSGISLDVSTHVGAAFASWVGGVALFMIAGVFVALISLIPPEMGSFDYRARILFQRQHGPHIEYIVSRIGKFLEHYVEHQERRFIISQYNQEEFKFFVTLETTTTVKSYIEDTETSSTLPLAIIGCTAPPKGERSPRLLFLRIDKEPREAMIEFQDRLEREYVLTIKPREHALVEQKTEYWVSANTEPCSHSPVRYVKRIDLSIENHLPNLNLELTLKVNGAERRKIVLRHGDRYELPPLRDIRPGTQAYDIRLLRLEPTL